MYDLHIYLYIHIYICIFIYYIGLKTELGVEGEKKEMRMFF